MIFCFNNNLGNFNSRRDVRALCFFLLPAKTWRRSPLLFKKFGGVDAAMNGITKFRNNARRRKTAAGSRQLRVETNGRPLQRNATYSPRGLGTDCLGDRNFKKMFDLMNIIFVKFDEN